MTNSAHFEDLEASAGEFPLPPCVESMFYVISLCAHDLATWRFSRSKVGNFAKMNKLDTQTLIFSRMSHPSKPRNQGCGLGWDNWIAWLQIELFIPGMSFFCSLPCQHCERQTWQKRGALTNLRNQRGFLLLSVPHLPEDVTYFLCYLCLSFLCFPTCKSSIVYPVKISLHTFDI